MSAVIVAMLMLSSCGSEANKPNEPNDTPSQSESGVNPSESEMETIPPPPRETAPLLSEDYVMPGDPVSDEEFAELVDFFTDDAVYHTVGEHTYISSIDRDQIPFVMLFSSPEEADMACIMRMIGELKNSEAYGHSIDEDFCSEEELLILEEEIPEAVQLFPSVTSWVASGEDVRKIVLEKFGYERTDEAGHVKNNTYYSKKLDKYYTIGCAYDFASTFTIKKIQKDGNDRYIYFVCENESEVLGKAIYLLHITLDGSTLKYISNEVLCKDTREARRLILGIAP